MRFGLRTFRNRSWQRKVDVVCCRARGCFGRRRTMCRPASCRRGLVSARRWLLTESHLEFHKATRQGSEFLWALVGFEIDNVELRID